MSLVSWCSALDMRAEYDMNQTSPNSITALQKKYMRISPGQIRKYLWLYIVYVGATPCSWVSSQVTETRSNKRFIQLALIDGGPLLFATIALNFLASH